MQTANLENLKERIRPFLRKYLESRDVKIRTTGHFICLNPSHKDKATPSGHLVPESNETYWTCFGCGSRGDIFTAAHWLEGLPLQGMEFVVENVQILAQRFSIAFEAMEMSEQDLYMMQLRHLYRDAADTLVEFPEERVMLDQRGWSKKLCYDMRVGVVKSWQEFRSRLMAKGNYTVKFLEDSGIYDTLFNPFCITFTLFDEYGNPIGFAARDSRWGKIQNVPKFRNTETRIPIFKKGQILYGMHTVRNKPIAVTLVEGYADVLTSKEKGIEGFVGILTSSLTDEQVELLQKYGKNDLVLFQDFDAESETGQTKTEECLDQVLSGKRNLRIRVADLAPGANGKSLDPDEFLRAQPDAAMAWTALPKVDAFQWRLGRMRAQPPEVTCETMIKLILNEPQRARQEIMLKQLADFDPVRGAGIRLEALQGDLDGQLYAVDRRRQDEARGILDSAQKKLRYVDPTKADQILDESAKKIKALKRDTRAIVTVSSALEMIDGIQDRFLNKGKGLPGLRTGWARYDRKMGGLAKEECFMVIGGIPHVGKTSWLAQLAWNVANLNEDVCVLFFSIDDAAGQIFPKLVSYETGFKVTHIAQPMEWLSTEQEMAALKTAWGKVKHLTQTSRLEVRDSTLGRSVNYLSHWIEQKQKQFKDRQIVAILDNFHKLVGGTGEKVRERFMQASSDLKQLSQSGGISILVTAEITKGANRMRPTLQDLMETVQLEHDATIGCIFHNELLVDDGSDRYWVDQAEQDLTERNKPIVDILVDKNKNIDGAYKGRLVFKFDQMRSHFVEEDLDQISPGEGRMADPPARQGGGHHQGGLGLRT